MALVEKATEVVDKWNEMGFIKETIYITQPSVWVFYPGSEFEGQRVLVGWLSSERSSEARKNTVR
jgi:hypothetical protein